MSEFGTPYPAKTVAVISAPKDISGEHRIELDATYGLLTTDVQTFSATGGTATAAGSMFTMTTGTQADAYAVIRSRRILRHRAGHVSRVDISAAFTTPVALSQQFAGAFIATDALFIGYLGTDFGIMRRNSGAVAIHKLTVTVGSGGVEELTLTLNGVAFVFSTAGVLSTTTLAEFIVEQTETVLTGWTGFSAQADGATVEFFQDTPAVEAGAFTLASDGTAAGTWEVIQAGAANVTSIASGAFAVQTAWNIDRLDGTRSGHNPSGMLLDPTKLNSYRIEYTDGGATFYVHSPDGYALPVHRIKRANTETTPLLANLSLRVGWVCVSLGSTTDLTVTGSMMAGTIEGGLSSPRDPFGRYINVTGGDTEYVAIAIRSRGEFGSTINQRELLPDMIRAGVETSGRLMTIRVYLNPTMTGAVAWNRHSTTSSVDYATPTTITPSSGTLLAVFQAAGSASAIENLAGPDGIRLEPGDVLAISVESVSAQTAPVGVNLSWHEV